ncbi:MAG TPA: cytochrome C biogenesis protein [bacterium]|nr:cytochrome C biogenesis protein [bacterium]
MIENLFVSLTNALEAAPFIAISASFVWGIISIVLSPCHLAAIPLIVGFIGAQGSGLTVKRAFLISLLFSTGILITIVAVGMIAGLAGMMMGAAGKWTGAITAVVFVVIGLYLLDIIKLSFMSGVQQPKFEKKGYFAAFVMGLIFGAALGPCTFAYMAPMLAVAFSAAAENMGFSILLVAAFAVGHCGVIVFAGTFTEVVEKYLRWTDKSKGVLILRKVCGVLVLLAAVYMVWTLI